MKIYLSKGKLAAIILYFIVNAIVYSKGVERLLETSLLVLGVLLVTILFPSAVAWLSSFGFMESLAKDSKSGLEPQLVSLVCWLLLILVAMSFIFNWGWY